MYIYGDIYIDEILISADQGVWEKPTLSRQGYSTAWYNSAGCIMAGYNTADSITAGHDMAGHITTGYNMLYP